MKSSINLAYIKEEDWERFSESIDDKENMHDTWEDWHNIFSEIKKDLISHGYIVNDFVIEIDELQDYCKTRGIKNDGEARFQFMENK